MTKKMFNLYVLLNVSLSVMIVMSIVLILIPYLSITSAGSVPKLFDNSLIRIESDSMMPEFQNNEMVVVSQVPPATLQIGDKIAYYKFDNKGNVSGIFFREIVEIASNNNKYLFKTKATMEPESDKNFVHESALIGKYDEKAGALKSLFSFSASSAGIIVLMIVPALSLVALQLVFFVLKSNAQKKNEEGTLNDKK